MAEKALRLLRGLKDKKRTLHRRLLLFFILVSVSVVLAFALLLTLFGITGKEDKRVQSNLAVQLSVLSDSIEDDFGSTSLGGITIAESISAASQQFFDKNGITAAQMQSRPDLIEPLLEQHIQTLIHTVTDRSCGGVFLMLDASQTDSDGTKAGIFIKKTQPTATGALGVVLHYLRGPADIARDNGIMLLGQWKMEFDQADLQVFEQVMDTARRNPDLPLSRLYYWSGRVTLRDNSESGFLLCVPLIAKDGTVFGVCGVEISDRQFKMLYTPKGGEIESIFTVMAPGSGDGVLTSQGLVAGNTYLTGNRWEYDLNAYGNHDGFVHYMGDGSTYGGKTLSVRLYPNGSPYSGQEWTVSVLMPLDILHKEVDGSSKALIWIVVALLAVSIAASFAVSKKYIKPLKDALGSIKTDDHKQLKETPFLEINDLFEFLSARDMDIERQVERLSGEKDTAEHRLEQAQTYLGHLAEERIPTVDRDSFEQFLQCLHTLTAKEREIFDLYMEGKQAKEIMEICNINQNTMKYHNKNIYSKLGVSSRKQLKEYAALMKISGKTADADLKNSP
ncbi:MAG: hypothetical protein IJE90_05980 [Clostridia bacterium]|nr:hypothetical protein [Clostridia bacterium]